MFLQLFKGAIIIPLLVIIVQGDTSCQRPAFKCNTNDLTYFEKMGQKIKCPSGSYCDYKKTDANCSYCTSINCNEYSCSDDGRSFSPTDSNKYLPCPTYYECTKTPPCNPCKPITCKNPPAFTCTSDTSAISNNTEYSCVENAICNKNNVFPCEPCIAITTT